MSSLARQLHKLAVPGQSVRYDELLVRRHSLLFDAREAAEVSNTSILSLALNGLDELQSIDLEAFEQFEQSIFSEESKTFQRLQQTRDVVRSLDDTLERFLRRLSPYVLLKPAHKCLEWLIRAYNVHQCNVDALIECVLPHHETNLFARVVQLLPLRDESSRWHWLLPLQKEGIPLPRAALLQHCASVPATLTFICEMVSRALQTGVSSVRTLVTFSVSTVIGVVELMVKIKEDTVARLLPFVLEGLRSSNVDWSLGVMMVVSQLCYKAQLDGKLAMSLVEIVAKHMREETVDESLTCIAYICLSQSIKKFSRKAVRYLCRKDYVMPSLQKVASMCQVDCLLELFTSHLMDMTCSSIMSECNDIEDDETSKSEQMYCTILVEVLKNLRLKKDLVIRFVKDLLQHYVSMRCNVEGESLATLHDRLQVLVRTLETRYSLEFDAALEEHLKELAREGQQLVDVEEMVGDEDIEGHSRVTGIQQQSDLIQELLSIALSGSRYAIVSELSSSTLTVSLHHPKAEVRRLAVLQLEKTIRDAEQNASIDITFYKYALLARLRDDHAAVVQTVIDMGQHLVDVVGYEDLLALFIYIMSRQLEKDRYRDKLWQQVCLSMTKLISVSLSSCSCRAQQEVLIAVLPHILLLPRTYKYGMKIVDFLATSEFSHKFPLISDLSQLVASDVWLRLVGSRSSPALLAQCNEMLLGCLSHGWCKMEEEERIKMINVLASYRQEFLDASPLTILTFGFMDCLLSSAENKQSLLTCGIAVELIEPSLCALLTSSHGDSSKVKSDDRSALVPQHIPQSLREALLPLMVKHQSSQIYRVIQLSGLQLRVAQSVCCGLCIPTSADEKIWLSVPVTSAADHQYTQVLLRLFDLLLEGSQACTDLGLSSLFQELFCVFMKNQLSDTGSAMRFLAFLWTFPDSSCQLQLPSFIDFVGEEQTNSQQSAQRKRHLVSSITKARSLLVAAEYLQSMDKDLTAALASDDCPVIPAFVVALNNPTPVVRELVLRCLNLINRACSQVNSPSAFQILTGIVCQAAAEITFDCNFVCRLLADSLSTTHMKKKKGQRQELLKRTSMLKCLMRYVTDDETPLYMRQATLELLKNVESVFKLNCSLPFLEWLLDKSSHRDTLLPLETSCMKLLIQQYRPAIVQIIGSDENGAWAVFEKCLHATRGFPSPQMLCLNQITRDFYKALKGFTTQQHLFSVLCDLAISDTNTVSFAVKQVMSRIHLKASHVIKELEKVKLGSSSTTPRKKAKQLQSGLEGPMVKQLQRSLALLEIIQQERNVKGVHLLLPQLFGMLNQCLVLTDTDDINIGYVVQLLLSCILSCCEQIAPNGKLEDPNLLREDQFSVELVVQCIRSSESPQTHQHALLLLNVAAQLFPESVMHKIMPIFTFMGASLLRMDDTYSMQIVRKTVETVVPAVLKATELSYADSTELIRTLLRVFVDALPHIPSHRQLPIMEHLLETLGVAEHLHEMLALLLEQVVFHSGDKQAKQQVVSPISEEFCVFLIVTASPLDQVTGLTRLLDYVRELPEEKPAVTKTYKQKRKNASTLSLFSIERCTAKQLQHFKLVCVSLVVSVLASEQYAAKVLDLSSEDELQLESNYYQLLEVTLTLISKTAISCDTHAQESTSKFWRVLLSKEYEVVEKLTQLLSNTALVEVVCQLLQHTNVTVRRKAMELFNGHVSITRGKYTSDQLPALLNLINTLTALVASVTEDANEILETPLNRQTALLSLKLLAKMLGSDQQQEFLPLVKVCCRIIGDKEETYQVVSSSLLCLAQLCVIVGPHLILYLPQFLPTTLDCLLDITNSAEAKQDLLQLSAATCLLKVVEHLSKFLSPYMVDILQRTCHYSFCQQLQSNSQLSDKVQNVRSLLAASVPVRVLYPAIASYYSHELDPESIVVLFQMLGESIQNMLKENVVAYTQSLVDIFMVALEYRTNKKRMALSKVAVVEDCISAAFLELVVKLSENAFRPLFVKLFDWASGKGSPRDRILTFYRLTISIAEKLKGLVVLFIGHIFGNCAQILDASNCSKTDSLYFDGAVDSKLETDDERSIDQSLDVISHKSRLLVHSVLDCLHKSFLYASESFVNKETFQSLLMPLVDQIENDFGGGDAYRELICGHLVPCVSQFAVAVVDKSLWKVLNYQVLLKTRHSSAKIRLGALHVMKQLYEKMGDEFVSLLPETIPFLSELMEDESLDVEKECRSVIKALEETLGESLQPYF